MKQFRQDIAAVEARAKGVAYAGSVAAAAFPFATAFAQSPSGNASPLPHDLSPLRMFLAADIVVQGVMASLMLASVVAWSIWLAKAFELARAGKRLRRGLEALGAARTLEAASADSVPARQLIGHCLTAAREELEMSPRATPEGVKERVASRLAEIEGAAVRAMRSGTGILASIGATAPFVGLFGTVWGIMNSFIGISRAQTTNLAVVAPGIAEALLATAIGLVAAIPAVVFYNHLTRAAAANKAILRDANGRIERLVSRTLDDAAAHEIPTAARGANGWRHP